MNNKLFSCIGNNLVSMFLGQHQHSFFFQIKTHTNTIYILYLYIQIQYTQSVGKNSQIKNAKSAKTVFNSCYEYSEAKK